MTDIWKIKKNIVLSIMELAKAAYPNEFSGMLVGDKDDKIIDDIYIIPATTNNLFSSSIRTDLVPMSLSVIGSVHSHPNNYSHPSTADLRFFSSKSINIIAHYPYSPESFVAYNSKGEEMSVKII
ncbi:MAG: Mov34/MPN/PAD-1 family protein [archaeon]